MKTLNIILALMLGSFSNAYSQQTFSNVSINNIHNCNILCFTTPREVNIMHYRIEASNDSLDFGVIGILRPSANSMLSKSYSYELRGYDYKYYRIAIVNMNASLQYSPVLRSKNDVFKKTLPVKVKPVTEDDTITVN